MRNKAQTIFIAYLDDDDQKITGYVDLLKLTDTYVTFLSSSQNEITIPINRLIKIKKKGEDDDT